jgi:hypothetical protein
MINSCPSENFALGMKGFSGWAMKEKMILKLEMKMWT